MENVINDFAESIAGDAIFEILQSNFNLHAINSPGPEDEDEGEEEEENEDEDEAATSDQGSDEEPPLDENVVHSPVPTKPGKPR